MSREPFFASARNIGSISFQKDRNSALAFAPSTSLTSLTPPKNMHSGTGTRPVMPQMSGAPKIATFACTFVSPANQSCRKERTPSRIDMDRLAFPALTPFACTSSASSFR